MRDNYDVFKNINYAKLFDLEHLSKMQDAFKNIVDCAMMIVDVNGNHIVKRDNSSDMCKAIKRTEKGRALCKMSDLELEEEAKKQRKTILRSCKSVGLTDVAIPIIVNDIYVATLFVGQINASGLTEDKVREFAREIGASEEELVQKFREVPVVDDRFFRSAIEFLEVFTKEISNVLEKNIQIIKQLEINKKNMEKIQRDYEMQLFFNQILQTLVTDIDDENILHNLLSDIRSYFNMKGICIFSSQASKQFYKIISCSDKIGNDFLQGRISKSVMQEYVSNIDENGYVFIDTNTLNSDYKKYIGEDIKLLSVFPVYVNKSYSTFMLIGDVFMRNWSRLEISIFKNIAYSLGSHLAREESDIQLRNSQKVLKKVLDNADASVHVIDVETKDILFANKIFCDINNSTYNEIVGKKCYDAICFGGEGYQKCELADKDEDVFSDSLGKWLNIRSRIITWIDGKEACIIWATDINDQKLYSLRVEKMAYTDSLLGVANRLSCEKYLYDCLKKCEKTGKTGAVMFVDLDNFKAVNDAYGHSYGDLLLMNIAEFFKSIKEIENSYFRFGGDEFVIIMDATEYEDVLRVANIILDRFRRAWVISEIENSCTISIGIAFYPEDGASIDEILRNADVAMYRAKAEGKDGLAVFDINCDKGFLENADIKIKLSELIHNKDFSEFSICYQPILNLQCDSIFGVEALLRWDNDCYGNIAPDLFISIIENTEIINELNLWILEQACFQCKNWCKFYDRDINIFVNFTLKQLQSPEMVKRIEDILNKNKTSPKNLYIEIHEVPNLDRMTNAISNISKLRNLGVKIVLDDFGSGIAAIGNLRQIQFDVLKTDSMLLDNFDEEYSKTLLESLTKIAHSLKAKVCIKGEGNENEIKFAKEICSDYMQVFTHNMPLLPEDVDTLLE